MTETENGTGHAEGRSSGTIGGSHSSSDRKKRGSNNGSAVIGAIFPKTKVDSSKTGLIKPPHGMIAGKMAIAAGSFTQPEGPMPIPDFAGISLFDILGVKNGNATFTFYLQSLPELKELQRQINGLIENWEEAIQFQKTQTPTPGDPV